MFLILFLATPYLQDVVMALPYKHTTGFNSWEPFECSSHIPKEQETEENFTEPCYMITAPYTTYKQLF